MEFKIRQFRNKRAFTLVELLVTITVLSILILLGAPRLLGYTEKAELTRIQHDVKVMEQEMTVTMLEKGKNFKDWDKNDKNLGALIMQKKLFGKEGVAEEIDTTHIGKDGIINVSQDDKNDEVNLNFNDNELGIGGDLIEIDSNSRFSVDSTYRIIPSEYKGKIKTKLKGTFYTNDRGKVYYEHDKPLKRVLEENDLRCETPFPDYEFDESTGTIVDWLGTEKHLVIPEAFKVKVNGEEKCIPVRVIGKGAFMQGDFRSIIIPRSVQIIEENAFRGSYISQIEIPHSVEEIKSGAFLEITFEEDEENKSVVIRNRPSGIYVADDAFDKPVKYLPITPKELGVVFIPEEGTIIAYNGQDLTVNIPPGFYIDDEYYNVSRIAKGAYQGKGLISVVLPQSLEIIEDYAFSGNQLEGVNIPNSVIHIGHYAFSFNEYYRNKYGLQTTIRYINIQGDDHFKTLSKMGNITDPISGAKLEVLNNKVRLMNHIFVTSRYYDVKFEEYVSVEKDNTIEFYNYDDTAYDGDLSTGSDKDGQLRWRGDLANKEISITTIPGYYPGYSHNKNIVNFIDKDGRKLKAFSYNIYKHDIPIGGRDWTPTTSKIIVPEGAVAMNIKIGVYTRRGQIFEIEGPINHETPKPITNLDSKASEFSIDLSWNNSERYDKVAIIRDDEFLEFVDGSSTSYEDNFLIPGKEYEYTVIGINKYGNSTVAKHIAKTIEQEIIFYSDTITQEAFDGNSETHSRTNGFVTWEGDLANKVIEVDMYSSTVSNFYMKDKYGKKVDFVDLDDEKSISNIQFSSSNKRFTKRILVPKDAVEIHFDYGRPTIYDLTVSDYRHPMPIKNVKSTSDDTSIRLEWDVEKDYQKALIYRDGNAVGITSNKYYIDKPLYSNSEHVYSIAALNDYGNSSNTVSHKEKTTNSKGIVFKGLNPEAFDGDPNTSHKTSGNVTWEGDLSNKVVNIDIDAYLNNIFIKDENGKAMSFVNIDSQTSHDKYLVRDREKLRLLIPEGAEAIYIDGLSHIYDITVLDSNHPEPVSNLRSSSSDYSIKLEWDNIHTDTLVYRDGKALAIVKDNYYIDSPLYAGTEYNYEIVALNESSNASKPIKKNVKTTNSKGIVFKGLSPEALDGNPDTSYRTINNDSLTWDIDLTGKTIVMDLSFRLSRMVSVEDANGRRIPFIDADTQDTLSFYRFSSGERKLRIVIPEGAVRIKFDNYIDIYDIEVID